MTENVIAGLLVAFALLSPASLAVGKGRPRTASYSEKELLENWALSRCLGKVAGSEDVREDAYDTAAAYLEYSDTPIEAYRELTVLVDEYASFTYAGEVKSRYDTMKCVDLFRSRELAEIASKLARARPSRHRSPR